MAFSLKGDDFHVRFEERFSVSLAQLFLGGGGGVEVTTCSLLVILRLSVSLCRCCFGLQYGTRGTRGFGEVVAF